MFGDSLLPYRTQVSTSSLRSQHRLAGTISTPGGGRRSGSTTKSRRKKDGRPLKMDTVTPSDTPFREHLTLLDNADQPHSMKLKRPT